MEKLNQHKKPRTCERNHEANRKRIGKTADLSAWTGLTGALDQSDWSCLSKGEQTGLAYRSDRWHPENPENFDSNGESQPNDHENR